MTRKISNSVEAVAKIVAANIGEVNSGIVAVPDDLFEKTLPSGLTIDNVKVVQNHTRDFIAGAGLALGEKGIELMKADKKLDSVSIKSKVVNDTFESQFLRGKDVPDGKGEGGRKTITGYLSPKYRVSGGAGAKGELKKVKSILAEQALAALA